ncbi:MAG: efflux RND transporter periplasmic adaptor subunit [Phenylobacterium sp.]|uniref:efflux RND transporter periplasmic adaptor subunit n=1 Tax=Phenylobacterium sp. TaxID=1871053 RepID=UPI0025EA9BB8|nr:efflux RND transporter periplasmic adaptor subunit [Phenylobacterium sp.]MBI1198561.1 efflux RND transporter periplasmic adaptor subunit [Phenylobacterium sp.]
MRSKLKLLAPALVVCLTAGCTAKTDTAAKSQASQAKVSVRVAAIQRGEVQRWIFGEGTARAVQREFLSFESPGRIAYLNPSLKEGDRVRKGQLIAYQAKNVRADDQPSGLSHVAVREAQANLELAQRTFDRFERLLELGSASQQEYDEAQAQLKRARVQYENASLSAAESRIVAPIDGVVARLNIEQGYYFSPQQVQTANEGAALSTVPVVIVNPAQYEVRVNLPSYAFGRVGAGADVLMAQAGSTGSAREGGPPPAAAIGGRVYAVSPSIDPETRTFAVRIRTVQGAKQIQDGEFMTVWIAGPVAEDAVVVPINALRYENSKPFVFRLDRSANRVSKAAIRTGLEGPSGFEVLAGLKPGDVVVTDGRSRLADGDAVRLIGAAPQPIE